MTRTGERASQAGVAGLVLVLNSGSSSVKFALVRSAAWPAAVCRFTEATGRPAAIGRLADAQALLAGRAGTLICPTG
jgi:hypothetical protein